MTTDPDADTRLLAAIRGSRRVLLTGPEGPDGDSIGACLALQRILAVVAPQVEVQVAGDPGYRYLFLPGAAGMVRDDLVQEADGIVILDGDRRRVPAPIAALLGRARWVGLVDHHRSTDIAAYDVAVFDAAADSTCGMVYGMGRRWGAPLDQDLAALLYAGIIFDTGGFRYTNTTAETHGVAAALLETGFDHAGVMLKVLVERRPQAIRLLAGLLADTEMLAGERVAMATCTRARLDAIGAIDADIEGVVDQLQHIVGVELAAVLLEKAGGRVKVSLRSRGAVDVSRLAHALHDGGGGHAKAAGVVLTGDTEAIAARLRAALADALV